MNKELLKLDTKPNMDKSPLKRGRRQTVPRTTPPSPMRPRSGRFNRIRVSHPYRVFISYAHEDVKLVERLDGILRDAGLIPVWDRDLRPGLGFTDDIKRRIATAHIFMPLFTRHSLMSPWVHQEVGFAVGIDVPVLGVGVNELPVGMIAGLQALVLDDKLRTLPQRLREVDFDGLVQMAATQPELCRLMVSSQVAEQPEERTRLLVNYTESISSLGRVRQRAYFSSFSLPSKTADWDLLDQERVRSPYYRDLLTKELAILRRHAEAEGCSLILRPILNLQRVNAAARRIRLNQLLRFLKSRKPTQVLVAISESRIAGNLTLVGDHLVVIAAPPRARSDFEQTRFIVLLRQACEVRAKCRRRRSSAGSWQRRTACATRSGLPVGEAGGRVKAR